MKTHTNDFTLVIDCDHVTYPHAVPEDQGVWVPQRNGESHFFCRQHATERLAIRLMDGLAVSSVAHLDAALLMAVHDDLHEWGWDNDATTPHYDRDQDYYAMQRRIGTAARELLALAQAKDAQLSLF